VKRTVDSPLVWTARVADGVISFLHETTRTTTADSPTTPPSRGPILCRFAELLSRLILSAPVTIVWQDDLGISAAECHTLGQDAYSTDHPPLTALSNRQTAIEYPPIALGWDATTAFGRARTVTWAREQGRSDGILWIFADSCNGATPRWKELSTNIPALKHLFLALSLPLSFDRFIASESIAQREIGLRQGGRSLVQARFSNVDERIAHTCRWLANVNRHCSSFRPASWANMAGEVLEAALTVLQDLLSTGWTDRYSVAYAETYAEDTSKLATLVQAVGDLLALGLQQHEGDTSTFKELRHVVDVLEALLNRRPPTAGFSSPRLHHEVLLRSLSLWTGLHELLRDRCGRRLRIGSGTSDLPALLDDPQESATTQSDQSATRSHAWAADIIRSADSLSGILAAGWTEITGLAASTEASTLQEAPGTHDPVSFRTWMNLWFALEVLRSVLAPRSLDTLLPGERAVLCADLAYIIRETVRRILYGRRQDYYREPATFSAALRTLVDYHAHTICGTPHEYDLTRLLENIGRYTGPDRGLAPLEHLVHVLDVFVTGQFLMSLEIRGEQAEASPLPPLEPVNPIRIGDRLGSPFVGRASDERFARFRRAFGVAALLHDYGYLLFSPHTTRNHALRIGPERRFASATQVAAATLDAAKELIRTCTSELVAGGVLEPNRDPEIIAWLDAQVAAGDPDHGLLAAHHLFQITASVRAEERDVIRWAVRAILLHGATVVPVDSDTDPAAALLLVCNELCEWEPDRSAVSSPSQAPRAARLLKMGLRRAEPCYRAVRISGLQHTFESGRLSSSLPDQSWPTLEIVLQPPGHLTRPSYLISLHKAQTIGRLRLSERSHWRPSLTIVSDIEPRLRALGLSGRSILEWLAQHSHASIRPWLAHWLTAAHPFVDTTDLGTETVRLNPLPSPLCPFDVTQQLSRLEREAEASLLGLELE